MASATVADPLPVPRLRTRAAAGKGEGGMVPAEAAGPGVEEVVAGRPEGNGPADVGEVGRFAPPVHGRALHRPGRCRHRVGGTRAVARRGRALAGCHLPGERPVALLRPEDHPLVAGGGEEETEAGCRGSRGQAVRRHGHQVARGHLPVDVAGHRGRSVVGPDRRHERQRGRGRGRDGRARRACGRRWGSRLGRGWSGGRRDLVAAAAATGDDGGRDEQDQTTSASQERHVSRSVGTAAPRAVRTTPRVALRNRRRGPRARGCR